ncbi:PH domain-containing protein [Bulleidia extructa]
MSDSNVLLTWAFRHKTKPGKEIQEILMPGEEILQCYSTVRDQAALSNMRIIIMDKQGITGRKTEVYSIPYRSIDMWSSENAGALFDLNSELELWTKAGHFKINLARDCDIREFDKILGSAILSNQ